MKTSLKCFEFKYSQLKYYFSAHKNTNPKMQSIKVQAGLMHAYIFF